MIKNSSFVLLIGISHIKSHCNGKKVLEYPQSHDLESVYLEGSRDQSIYLPQGLTPTL